MKLREIVTNIVIDSRKLTEYALNPNNPKGADKAIMFERHLGFTKNNYQLLKKQIEMTALDADATLQKTDIHGQRYQVDLEITGIRLRQQEIVRTGWIVEQNSKVARLVTLYIKRKNESTRTI
jgi:hypothetical protein